MICKVINKKINPFMSFGKMPIANGFLYEEDFKKEFFFDLKVGFSEDLSLFQLQNHPTPEQMFNERYPFFTGSSEFMKNHFYNFAEFIKKNYLKNNSKIIEIGSNDGTCLQNFKKTNIEYIGFEPSANVANIAKKRGINTLNNFFNLEALDLVKDYKKNTSVIFAANVICHVPNLINLIKSVDQLLTSDGVFIFEEPYLGSMFKKTSYDQIYDEHVFMFSGTSIQKIFNLFDMELVDLIKQSTHGGSMRYVIARKGKKTINKNVYLILDEEKLANLDNLTSCIEFKKNCEMSKKKIVETLHNYKSKEKKICGYAATSKSTTVLNYCGLDKSFINCIYDSTKEKIGKFTPGTHIPIKSTESFNLYKPEIAYLFAWNHKEEIFNKEKIFLKRGGKWISHVDI